jgi:hypothetical protein
LWEASAIINIKYHHKHIKDQACFKCQHVRIWVDPCDYYYLMSVRKGILLLLLVSIASCQITSRPIQTAFTSYGAFESFQISWKPTREFSQTCLLEVTFPETIHLGPTPLTYSLADENGVSYLEDYASIAPTSNVYYFSANQPLAANIWYIITIYPTKSPSLVYGLVGIRVIGGVSSSNIAYLSNSAF